MAIEYRQARGTPEILDQEGVWGAIGAIRYRYRSYRGFSVLRSIPIDNMEEARVHLERLEGMESAIDVTFIPLPHRKD